MRLLRGVQAVCAVARLRLPLALLLLVIMMTLMPSAPSVAAAPRTIPVQVVGIGPTVPEARADGFRRAVQQAYGALVLTERRISNDELHEDLVSYSRGLVHSHTVTATRQDAGGGPYYLDMIVQVSATELGRQIVARRAAGNVAGAPVAEALEAAHVQVELENERHRASRRLLEHLLGDLPLLAIEVDEPALQVVKEHGDVRLEVTIDVRANRKVLNRICQAARAYADTRSTNDIHSRLAIEVSKGFLGCNAWPRFIMDGSFLVQWRNSLDQSGLCLTLQGTDGGPLARTFRPTSIALSGGFVGTSDGMGIRLSPEPARPRGRFDTPVSVLGVPIHYEDEWFKPAYGMPYELRDVVEPDYDGDVIWLVADGGAIPGRTRSSYRVDEWAPLLPQAAAVEVRAARQAECQ